MMPVTVSAAVATMRLRGEQFFRWWLHELRALVPKGVEQFLGIGEAPVYLHSHAEGFTLEDASGGCLRRLGVSGETDEPAENSLQLRNRQIILALPSSLVLRRHIELPLSAERELATALSFEIDRQTPFSADRVYHSFQVRKRDTDRKVIAVELAAGPKHLIDPLLARAAACGVTPAAMSIEGDLAKPSLLFMPNGRRRSAQSWRAEPWKPLLALAVGLLVTGVAASAWHLRTEAARAQSRVEAERGTGARAEALRQKLSAAQTATLFLPEKLTAPRVTEILDALSRLMPDDSWIFALEVSGRDVRIAGFSADVPQLIKTLQQSALFDDPQLRAPVVRGPGKGGDRFDLGVTVKPSRP
jgi:general secretion pathway protein L